MMRGEDRENLGCDGDEKEVRNRSKKIRRYKRYMKISLIYISFILALPDDKFSNSVDSVGRA